MNPNVLLYSFERQISIRWRISAVQCEPERPDHARLRQHHQLHKVVSPLCQSARVPDVRDGGPGSLQEREELHSVPAGGGALRQPLWHTGAHDHSAGAGDRGRDGSGHSDQTDTRRKGRRLGERGRRGGELRASG